jgi:predicted DNA-binding protein
MLMSIEVTPKKRGRPATGKDPLITVRLPRELIEAANTLAKREGISRSGVIRAALEAYVASKRS